MELIDRDAAIKAITGINAHGNSDRANALGLAEFQLTILPAVDAVPVVHGRWIDGHRSRFDGTRYWFRQCDQCLHERDDDDPDKDTNFCPNCGAKMDGKDGNDG